MSEERQTDKQPGIPVQNSDTSAAPGPGSKTSKTYEELLQGFAEITKIQANQEVFEKRGAGFSFETIKKKSMDKRGRPEG